MSLEERLAELTAATTAHTAAVNTNSDLLKRVIAGQEAALAKLGEGKPTTTTRKTKDDPPKEAASGTSTEGSGGAGGAPAGDSVKADVVTDEMLKAAAMAWMDGKSKEERTAAAGLTQDAMEHLGFARNDKVTGPEAKLTPEHRKQMKFFIERWAAGLSVNFKADYDFDGPIDQGAEAETDDQFG